MNNCFEYFVLLGLVVSLANCWPNFDLYNSANPVKERQVSPQALKQVLTTSRCSCYKEFILIVHGFLSDGEADWMIEMKDALLEKSSERSIILVDWKEGAKPTNGSVGMKALIGALAGIPLGPAGPLITGPVTGLFATFDLAAANVPENGRKIAEFILESGIDPKKVHCIGHSLGAHSCGLASKIVKFGRISGLDPAGPGFTRKPHTERLDSSDADFVDIIHTNTGTFGITTNIGHVDFYPNGGDKQPGCSTTICKHSAAHQYYIQSIKNPNSPDLTAHRTADYETYKQYYEGKGCNGYYCAQMGYGVSEASVQGIYHLTYPKKD